MQDGQVRNGIYGSATVHGSVQQARQMTFHQYATPAAPVEWPVVIGRIPPKATAFQPREQLREAIDEARGQYGTVVLSQVLAGGGGVGKSQLAAHYAREAVETGTDLVLWADAAEPSAVTDLYARAAIAVQAPGTSGDAAEQDAEHFLAWLTATEHSWLIVLDNTTEHTPEQLWPVTSRGGRGRVIATTRHRGAASTGGDRALVDVSTYSPAESAAYLGERLERAKCARFLDEHAAELAEELGHLPLALAHAAAYMVNTRRSCGRYLELFRDRPRSLDTVLPARTGADGYRGPVTAALLLALDAAQQEEPVGLAGPALQLAALLDPAGHPQGLWSTEEVLEHLGSVRGTPVTADDALDALAVLHNYSLVTLTETTDREVTLHALTARAALDIGPDVPEAWLAAADALAELWPSADYSAQGLAATLRANTGVLAGHRTSDLIRPSRGIHQLLFYCGISLIEAGLYTTSIRYWSSLAAASERVLGIDHPDTLTARNNLAAAYSDAGHTDEAMRLQEEVLEDRRRVLGDDHPDTLTTRNNLAVTYRGAGRTDDAVSLLEQVLEDRRRVLGDDHPDTLTARHNLAVTESETGRIDDAVDLLEQVLEDRRRVLDADHPDTLLTCNNLAVMYWEAGLRDRSLEMLRQAVADLDRVLGPDHPDTALATENLRDLTRGPQPDAAHDSSTRSPSSEAEPGSAV
ncbi:tetratricopeptide repeat protein [Kitasatospora xanthocidica]|uniref:Tetratricopeptide repeat protein n=1 Tax=Kitasatospora xanthocidica TaxID=83382 RepID=A0A372ZSQ6_9ACTN|nr:tetratricopeptide repeat protein [Kitasatospora xanthocidica]RGD58430.1 tetratricopeptide repeat protein [Kitasatospora xanthocidica]